MTAPSEATADRIRAALPDLPKEISHNLMYFCQGHYVAEFLEPLFLNDILVTPSGAEIGVVRTVNECAVTPVLSEAERKVVADVIARYGSLTEGGLAEMVFNTERGGKPIAAVG